MKTTNARLLTTILFLTSPFKSTQTSQALINAARPKRELVETLPICGGGPLNGTKADMGDNTWPETANAETIRAQFDNGVCNLYPDSPNYIISPEGQMIYNVACYSEEQADCN